MYSYFNNSFGVWSPVIVAIIVVQFDLIHSYYTDYLVKASFCPFCRVSGVFSTESPSAEPLTSVADCPEASSAESERPTLPRSHSERLLAANRDFVSQEKELRERYHETIYNTAEKVMRLSQTNQVKALRVNNFLKLVFLYLIFNFVKFVFDLLNTCIFRPSLIVKPRI